MKKITSIDEDKKRDNLYELVIEITDREGIPIGVIYSDRRDKKVATIRHFLWYIGVTVMDISYSDLAREFNRDHSTILYGVNKLKGNPDYEQMRKYVVESFPHFVDENSDYAKTLSKGAER